MVIANDGMICDGAAAGTRRENLTETVQGCAGNPTAVAEDCTKRWIWKDLRSHVQSGDWTRVEEPQMPKGGSTLFQIDADILEWRDVWRSGNGRRRYTQHANEYREDMEGFTNRRPELK